MIGSQQSVSPRQEAALNERREINPFRLPGSSDQQDVAEKALERMVAIASQWKATAQNAAKNAESFDLTERSRKGSSLHTQLDTLLASTNYSWRPGAKIVFDELKRLQRRGAPLGTEGIFSKFLVSPGLESRDRASQFRSSEFCRQADDGEPRDHGAGSGVQFVHHGPPHFSGPRGRGGDGLIA